MSWPAFDAGSARLTIQPDFGNTFSQISARVRGYNAPAVTVPLKLQNVAEFQANAKAAINAVQKTPIKLRLDIDSADAAAHMQSFRQTVSKPITINVDADTTAAKAKITELGALTRDIQVGIDTTVGTAQLAAFRAAATKKIVIPVEFDTAAAREQLSSTLNRRDRRAKAASPRDAGESQTRGSVQAAEANVERVAARLARARTQQTDATERLTLAEKRLEEVHAKGSASESQVLAATQAVARARRTLESRTGAVSKVLSEQSSAHGKLQAAQVAQAAASRSAGNALDAVATSATQGAGALIGMANPASLVSTALAALAGVSLIPLIGQLAQAAGVISLLPAMGAAAAATIGTLALGASGVKDAITKGFESAKDGGEEAEKAAKAAGKAQRTLDDARKQAARTAEQGAESIRRAEKGVQSAQADSVRAQEDLTRARKDAKEQIEDLNLALKGSALDEEDAIIAVERAAERIRNLGKDGDPVSALDRREANNDYKQAIQRLAEVRERNNDLRLETEAATAAGVEGSEQVVAAKEKVTAAADAEVEAQRDLDQARRDSADANADAQQRILDAQEALNEALSESGTKAREFDEAMALLSPNAQAFVNSILGMRDAWQQLKFAVQDSLFDGIGPKLQELSETYMPTLTTGLTGLADVLNGGLKSAMDWLMTDQVQGDISNILTKTTEALGPLLNGLGHLGRAMLDITAVGAELLPGLMSDFEGGSKSFADSIAAMREDGSLKSFMQDAIDTFKQLWEIAKNIGGIAVGLVTGSDEVGESWLTSIEDATKKWSDMFQSGEGQEKLKSFFQDVKQIVADILSIVQTTERALTTVNTMLDRVFPDAGSGASGTVSAVNKAANGDFSGAADSLGEISGTAFNSGIRAMGGVVSPFSGEAFEIGKSGWRWLGGLFGGDDAPAEVPEPPEGYEYTREELEDLGSAPRGGGRGGIAGRSRSAGVDAEADSDTPGILDRTREAWEGLSSSIGDGWTNTIAPAWDGFTGKVGEIGSGFADKIGGIASGAWSGLSTNVSEGWNNTIMPTWNTLQEEGLGGLADKFTEKITNGAITSWSDLPSKIGSGAWSILNEHFPGLSGGLDTLRTKFDEGVAAIGRLWESLKGKLAGPIKWVIDTVYNDGIVRFWNAIAPKIGLGEMTEIGSIEVPAYAKGGTVDGVMSGYSPGVDDRIIAVGGGEAVMRPEWTRAVGPDFVDGANQAARQGGVAGAKRFMGFYADGGVVASMEAVVRKNFPELLTNDRAFSGLRFTDNGHHSTGQAADFSNGGDAGTPEMTALSNFIADNYQERTLELIHSPFNRNIKDYDLVGNGVGTYGAGTMADHRNHVHWAVDGPVSDDIGDPSLLERAWGAVKAGARAVTSKFRDMAANLFEKPLNTLGSTIPNPFPGLGDFGQVPKAAFDAIAKAAIDKVRGSAAAKDGSSSAGSSGAALGEWGGTQEDYAREIVAAAKDRGLPSEAAAIGIATALVESEMRMYANNSVPDSLNYPHDAIGSDFDSVGLFQQRNNGAWGTTEQRMNPKASAGMFFDQLMTKDWQNMDRGAAAQAVQVSAFPEKYAQRMDEADAIVARLYDTGGNLSPGLTLVNNQTGKDEYVLNPDGFEVLKQLIDMGESLIPAIATMLGQPQAAPAASLALTGARKMVDEAQLASSPQQLTEADMLANMAPEARSTFEEYGQVPEGGTPEQRMAQWSETYSQKWANWGRDTVGELIDDSLSPLGGVGMRGVSIGTMVTQNVPDAVTRLARLADMQARGYTRTIGR